MIVRPDGSISYFDLATDPREARDLAETVHPHPTLSETMMNASETFFGTATEIYKPKRHKEAATS